MLTKELRQEALKKGFHYPKVEKSVEFYRTKNLMIYDFVCEESAVVRIRKLFRRSKPVYKLHAVRMRKKIIKNRQPVF